MANDIASLLPLAGSLLGAALSLIVAYVYDVGHGSYGTDRFRLPYMSQRSEGTGGTRKITLFFFVLGIAFSGAAPALYVWWNPDAFRYITDTNIAVFGGAASALTFLVLAGVFLASRTSTSRSERLANAGLVFKLTECAVLVLGAIFAAHTATVAIATLKRNAESNRTAARAQIYAADNTVTDNENRAANSKLVTIYSLPRPLCKSNAEAFEYTRQMLAMVTTDPLIIGAKHPSELYGLIFGPSSVSPPGVEERSDIVELRRMLLHCTSILNMIHACFDEVGDIIERSEYDTWAGYFKDIGPHPVFLTTIWLWNERGYMSREFADEVRATMFVNASLPQKRVVSCFWPEMASGSFGQELPGGYAVPVPSRRQLSANTIP